MSTPAGPEGSGLEISAEEIQEIRKLLEDELQKLTTVEPDESGLFPISAKSLEAAVEQLEDKTGPFFHTATLFLNIIKKQKSETDAGILAALTSNVLGTSNSGNTEEVAEDSAEKSTEEAAAEEDGSDEVNAEDKRRVYLRGIIIGIITELSVPKEATGFGEDSIDDSSLPPTPPLYTGSSDAGSSPGTTSAAAEPTTDKSVNAARDLTEELAAAATDAAELEGEKPAAPPTYIDVAGVNSSIREAFGSYSTQDGNGEKIGNINLFVERLSAVIQSMQPQDSWGYQRRQGATKPKIELLTASEIEDFKFLSDTWNILSGQKRILLSDLEEGKEESAAAKIFGFAHPHRGNEEQQLVVILSGLVDGPGTLFDRLQQLDQIALFRSIIHQPLPESSSHFSKQQKAEYDSQIKARYQRVEELLATPEAGRVSTDNAIESYKLLLDILTGKTDINEHLGNDEIPIARLLELFQHSGLTSTNQEKLIDLVNKLLTLDVITTEAITTIIEEAVTPVVLQFPTYADLYQLSDEERDYRIGDQELRRRLQSARSEAIDEKRRRVAVGVRLSDSETDRSRLTILSQTLERKYDELVRQVEALKQARGEAYLELPEVAKDRISDLEASNKELVADIKKLRAELAQAQRTIEEKEEEIFKREDQTGAVQGLGYRLREASGRIQSLSADNEILQVRFTSLAEEKEQAEKALDSLGKHIKTLKLALDRKHDAEDREADAVEKARQLTIKNEELAVNNRRLFGIEQRLTATTADLEQVRKDLDDEKAATAELKQRLREVRQDYTAQLQAQAEKLTGETRAAEAVVTSIREEVSTQVATIEGLEQQLATARVEIEQLRTDVGATVEREALVSAKERELEVRLERQDAQYKQELQEQQQRFTAELTRANASTEAAKTESAALQLKIDGQELQVTGLNQQLAQSNLERKALSKIILELESHSESTSLEQSQEIVALKSGLAAKDAEIENINMALADKTSELERLRSDVTISEQRAELAEKTLADTKYQLDEVRAELRAQQEAHVEQLRLQQEQSAQDLSEAQANTAAADAIASKLRLQLGQKDDSIAKLETKLKDAGVRAEQISERLQVLEKSSAESKESDGETIAELNKELLKQQQLVEKLTAEKSAEQESAASLTQQLKKLEAELESYKTKLMTAETTAQELSTELKAANEEFDAERAAFRAELETTVKDHRLEIAEFESTVAANALIIAEKLQAIKSLDEQIVRLKAEREGDHESLSKKIDDLTTGKSTLEREVTELKSERDEFKAKLTAATDSYDKALADQNAAFAEERERLAGEVTAKQGELDAASAEHSSQIKQLEAVMAGLETQRDDATSQIEIEKRGHLEGVAEVARLKSELASSESRLQTLQSGHQAHLEELGRLDAEKYSALSAQFVEAQKLALAAEAQVAQLQTVTGEQSAELKAARSSAKDASERLAAVEKKHAEELKLQKTDYERKIRLSNHEISRRQATQDSLANELSKARVELRGFKGYIEGVLPEEIQRLVAEHTARMASMDTRLSDQTQAADTAITKLLKIRVGIDARFTAYELEKSALKATVERLERELEANTRKTEAELLARDVIIAAKDRLFTQALAANAALREEYQIAKTAIIAERDITVRRFAADAAFIAKKAEEFEQIISFGNTVLLQTHEQKTALLLASGVELAAKQVGLAKDGKIAVEQRLAVVTEQKERLKEGAAGLGAEIDALRQSAVVQEAREGANAAELAAARSLAETQRQELVALRESSAEQLAEKEAAHQGAIAILEARIASLKSEGEGQTDAIAALRKEIEELNARHSATLTEMATANAAAVAKLQESFAEQEEARARELERIKADAEARIEGYETRQAASVAALAAAESLAETRKEELTRLRASSAEHLVEKDQEHQEAIAGFESQIAELRSQVGGNEGEIVKLQGDIEELQNAHRDELEKIRLANAAAVAKLQESVAEKERRVRELESAKAVADDRIEGYETRQIANAAELAAAHDSAEKQRQELAALQESSSEKLREQEAAHQGVIAILEARIASLESDGEGQADTVAALRKEIGELNATHLTTLKEIESANTAAEDKLRASIAEQEGRVRELESAKADADARIRRYENRQIASDAALAAAESLAREKLLESVKLHSSLKQKDTRINELERENKTLLSKISKYEEKERAIRVELDAAKALVATREAELEQMQQGFTDQFERLNIRHASTIRNLKSEVSRLRAQGDEKAGAVAALEKRIEVLQQGHKAALEEIQSRHAATVAVLETTIDRQTTRIGELESAIESITAEKTIAEERLRVLEPLVAELRQSLQARDAQIAQLTAQRDATGQDRDQQAVARLQIEEELIRERVGREFRDRMIAELMGETARLRAELASKETRAAEQEAALSTEVEIKERLGESFDELCEENERLERALAALKAEPKVDDTARADDIETPPPASPSPAIATPPPPPTTPVATSWGGMVRTMVNYAWGAVSRSSLSEARAVTSPLLADLEVEVDLGDPPAPRHELADPASPAALQVDADLDSPSDASTVLRNSKRRRPAPLSPAALSIINPAALPMFGSPLIPTPDAGVAPGSPAAAPASPLAGPHVAPGSPTATTEFATPLSTAAVGTPAAPADTLRTPQGGRARHVTFADADINDPALVPPTPATAPTAVAVPPPGTDEAPATTTDLAPAPAAIPVATHTVFTSAHVKQDPYFVNVVPETKILKVTTPKIKVDVSTTVLEKQHRKTALALEVFLMTYLAGSGKGHPPVLRVKGADPELVALYSAFVELFSEAGMQSTFTRPYLVSDVDVGAAKGMIAECFDISAAADLASAGLDRSVVDLITSLYLSGGGAAPEQYQTYLHDKMGWAGAGTGPGWGDNNALFSGRHVEAMSSDELSPVFSATMVSIASAEGDDFDDADYTVLQNAIMGVNGIDSATVRSRSGTPRL